MNYFKKNFLLRITILALCVTLTHASDAVAQNPFLPPTAFVPDGEPHVFEYKGEKRLFVYGSRDERVTAFCGYGHDAWSAPINDLTKWTNHGEIFHVKQVWDIGYGIVDEQHFGAPDCVYNPLTKKYYLYTFLGAPYIMDGKQGPLPGSDNYVAGFEDYGPKCIMAVSDSPVGPFTDPVVCNWPAANKDGTFDPAVLVDIQPDGSLKVYAYWGMRGGDRYAEIDPKDMHTIINPQTGEADLGAFYKTLDAEHLKNTSLFEASSIRKVADNKYVFIYSSNERKSALTYCYGSSPLGPWEYRGQIVHNDINAKGGNNHGSIVKVLDQWYVVYHKPTTNSHNRQAMIEPIEVIINNGKVNIPTVEMTSQGVIEAGLDAYKRYNANTCCYLTNKAYIDGIQRNLDGINPIVGITGENTILGFKYFNFGNKAVKKSDKLKLKLNCKLINSTQLAVFVALPENANLVEKHIKIGSMDVLPTSSKEGDFENIEIPISNIENNDALKKIGGLKGKLAVFISFNGENVELCQLKEIEFVKNNKPTPNPLHEIKIETSMHGTLSTTASRSRSNESVKVSVFPDEGYQLASIKVVDNKGNQLIAVQANKIAPYAPESYNFLCQIRK